MEAGEVFDSQKLKNTVNYLIENEIRYVIIDLSPLDYLYSDAINVITSLNGAMIKVDGHLGVLATNQKVLDIIGKSGLQNIVRVYDSEAAILDHSREFGETASIPTDVVTEDPMTDLSRGLEDSMDSLTSDIPLQDPVAAKKSAPAEDELLPLDAPPEPKSKKMAPLSEEPEAEEEDTQSPESKRSRLGPSERLRNPSGRARVAPRPAGRKWSNDGNSTGLVIVDDSLVDAEAPPTQRNMDRAANLAPEKNSSSFAVILVIVFIAILAVGGVYFMFAKKGDSSTEQVAAPTTQVAPQVVDSAVTPPPAVTPAPVSTPVQAVKPVKTSPPVQPKAVPQPQKSSTPVPAKPLVKPVQKPVAEPVTPPAVTKTSPLDEEEGDEESTPAPIGKVVEIVTTPPGATIKLNGTIFGQSPNTVTILTPSVNLEVSLEGYETYVTKLIRSAVGSELKFTLKSKNPPPKPVVVAPPPVSKPVVTPPPAPVVSKPVVSTPPPPAPAASSPLDEEEAAPAATASGEIGKVFVASRPPAASVFIDGKDTGFKTPHWVEVGSGKHTVMLKKDGMSASKQIQVSPGKNKSEYIILQ